MNFAYKISLLVCLTFTLPYCLTFEEIKAKLAQNPKLDTLESKVEIKITGTGISSISSSHIFTKGPDKLWMETVLPGGKTQKTIKNGNRLLITNPMTGEEQVMPIGAMEVQNPLDMVNAAFGDGQLAELMKKPGVPQYVLKFSYGGNSQFKTQVFTYDETINQIIQVESTLGNGESSKTTIEYCANCEIKLPKQLVVFATVKGEEVKTEINFTLNRVPKNISDNLFKIN
ncbi:hypothetical protein ACFL5V_00465 [Fibrobacterota bacterium]